jgi:hypothetical protein
MPRPADDRISELAHLALQESAGALPRYAAVGLILVIHMHKGEHSLVREFVRRLRSSRSPWGKVQVAREFSYQRGRADVLALQDKGDHLIAFEAKLIRWRDALHQAYRNTCFAHTSFVLLPRRTAMIAERYEAEFRRRNIGLCYLEKDEVVVVHSPETQTPIEPWLLDQARAAARKSSNGPTRSRSGGPEDLPRT